MFKKHMFMHLCRAWSRASFVKQGSLLPKSCTQVGQCSEASAHERWEQIEPQRLVPEITHHPLFLAQPLRHFRRVIIYRNRSVWRASTGRSLRGSSSVETRNTLKSDFFLDCCRSTSLDRLVVFYFRRFLKSWITVFTVRGGPAPKDSSPSLAF